jgi:hypothetical protein
VGLIYTHQQLMWQSAAKDVPKGAGYSHRPNTTNAILTTVAMTIAASNVVTNTKPILAGLSHIF